jgi:hypothetical protein
MGFKKLYIWMFGTYLIYGLMVSNAQANDYFNATDKVTITSTEELIGPDGLNTTCSGIAWLYFRERTALGGGPILTNGSGHSREYFSNNEEWANVKFIDWTDDTLNFLLGAIDRCVSDNSPLKRFGRVFDKNSQNNPSYEMSPSDAKNMFKQIYSIAENTRKYQSQQVENLRLKKEQQFQLEQNIKSGAVDVTNVQEAAVKFKAADAYQLVSSPMVKPDGKNYQLSGFLEKFKDTSFIASTYPLSAISSAPYNTRFIVLVPQAMMSKYQSSSRVGGRINMIGRYVGNRNVTLVTNATVTVPVFDMLYLE